MKEIMPIRYCKSEDQSEYPKQRISNMGASAY